MNKQQQSQETVTLVDSLIAMEKAALEKWNQGNPDGFLSISAPDVVYFDPFTDQRLDGLDQLTAWYENIRGQIHVDHYEMISPRVQATGNIAVLTFNLQSQAGLNTEKWNCTEVYRLEEDQSWRIIQTHWSFTKPTLQ